MPLGMEVGLGAGDFVLDGDPAPVPKKGMGPPPQFSAHFYCCLLYTSDAVAWAEAYLHAKYHLDPSNCLATTWAEKLGGRPLFGEGERGPRLTQSRLRRGLLPHEVAS